MPTAFASFILPSVLAPIRAQEFSKVSERQSKHAGNRPVKSEIIKMNAAVEARQLLIAIAGPAQMGSSIKEAINIVALKTGLTHRRIRGIWNRETRAIRAEELDALRLAAKPKAPTNELLALAADFTALAERASRLDPEMVGPWADAMRDIAGKARSLADGGRS